MTQDELKLVFDALKQCTTYAFAGGLGVRATAHTNALAILEKALAQTQEPVAWRTFDGEGGYDYCSYEDNESYADDWNKRNPNHKGWVEPLYTHPPQPEQEPVAWMYQEYRDDDQFGWRDEIQFVQPPNDPNYFREIVPVYTTPPQPEQEPVKMVAYNCFCGRTMKFESVHGVVAPQRTWVGLAAGEILDTLISVDEKTVRLPSMLGQFACAIEAKLKQKNGYAEDKNT